MFEIEKFALFVYEQCDQYPLFCYSVVLQKIVDNNAEVIHLSNIIRAISNLKKSGSNSTGIFFSKRNNNYNEVFMHFKKALHYSNNFIYFHCKSKEYPDDESVVVVPYKMYKELKNRLLKFNNLKSFT
jgi:hypothetical protein